MSSRAPEATCALTQMAGKSTLFSVELGFAEIEFPLEYAQNFIANAALITQLHGRLAFHLQQLAREVDKLAMLGLDSE